MRRSATARTLGRVIRECFIRFIRFILYCEDDSIDCLRKVKEITEEYAVPWTPNFSIVETSTIPSDGEKRKIDKCTWSFTFSDLKRNFTRNASKGSESGRDGNKTTKISMKLLVDSKIASPLYRWPQFSLSSIFMTFRVSFSFFLSFLLLIRIAATVIVHGLRFFLDENESQGEFSYCKTGIRIPTVYTAVIRGKAWTRGVNNQESRSTKLFYNRIIARYSARSILERARWECDEVT